MSDVKMQHSNDEAIQKLGKMIKDIDFAMFTTVDEEGVLRSRPMSTQQVEFDGDLWFFTREDTGKVEDVRTYQQVNVAYASPGDQRYVSVMGVAEVLNDRAKMSEFWNPAYKAYFPEGLNDPQLRLIKVTVQEAEYWDSPGGKMAQAIGFVKALVTGDPSSMGENKKIELESSQKA
jgi:general stress protein 26